MTSIPNPSVLANAVREIANQYPNRNGGEICKYVDETDTSRGVCIIGWAFLGLGVDIDWNAPSPHFENSMLNVQPIMYFYDDLPFDDTEWTSLKWLAAIQTYQDNGDSWELAVELADRDVPGAFVAR